MVSLAQEVGKTVSVSHVHEVIGSAARHDHACISLIVGHKHRGGERRVGLYQINISFSHFLPLFDSQI